VEVRVRVMARVHEDEGSGVVEALFPSLASTRLHPPTLTLTLVYAFTIVGQIQSYSKKLAHLIM
jgi:hypothetical protein